MFNRCISYQAVEEQSPRKTTFYAGYTLAGIVSHLRRLSETTEYREGRITPVPSKQLNDIWSTPRGKAALELTAECPLRVQPFVHITGEHIHLRCKRSGRIGCYSAKCELLKREEFLEDHEPTKAQQALVASLRPAPIEEYAGYGTGD
jgi:hypothetical protein